MGRRNRPDSYVDSLYNEFNNNPSRNRTSLYERMYVRILGEIAINRFKWNDLPTEIDRRFIELELFRHALVVFWYDSDDVAKANGLTTGFDRYFALRGSGAGKWNMYDNPTSFRTIGNTMISRTLYAGNHQVGDKRVPPQCVPIWANALRVPDWDIIYLQSTKLAETERTIELTLKAMRMPYVFAVPDTERLSVVNLMRQHDEGIPVVYGTESLLDTITNKMALFDLGIDKEMVLNLMIAKSKIWNETMTMIGINNANQEKRERLVSDEVSANDSQVLAVRNSALSARQYAVEQINNMYDLNVSVEWNETTPLNEDASTRIQTEYGSVGSSAQGGGEV